jgi:hypothetical protein
MTNKNTIAEIESLVKTFGAELLIETIKEIERRQTREEESGQ